MEQSKWQQLMCNLGFDENSDTYNELLKSYSEKHRHYHNASHINAILIHLQQAKHLATDCDAIEVALWFHDAIYKTTSSTNELDSANWATSFLEKNNAKNELIDKVHSLIMSTLHDALPTESDAKLMVDIDLSILGSPPKTYDLFEASIRKEYRLVPSFIYKIKRKEILNSFLQRDRIYSHQYFYDKLETSARINISNAIKVL